MITQEFLKSIIKYNPETGDMQHIKMRKPQGISLDSAGYRMIGISGKLYRVHRIAWMLTHGDDMPEYIDHINGDKSDNRIENLRPATNSQNMCNTTIRSDNTSGFKGVCFHNQRNKWMARISLNNKQVSLGLYSTKEQASAAYHLAAYMFYGEFYRPA
ncbi:HNH endonuclease [Pantoea sp. UYEF8]|uniref:HNH endonuclease n=1 Tax=Pantoea sp. UYEF8 TaxID=1756394 RepID=UPI003391B0A3